MISNLILSLWSSFFSDGGCNGGDACCKPYNKCGAGEGDCDTNNDCKEGLKCGTNNCGTGTGKGWLPWDPLGWDREDDCCYKPLKGTLHFRELGKGYCKNLTLIHYLNTIVSYILAWKRLSLAKISNEIQKTTDWKKLEGYWTKKK